jgi:multidrug efflux pump subunit AcrA (membrane-fusion protein)
MVTLEELQTIVAQSVLSTEAFKAQLAASQEQADRRAAEAKIEADRRAAEADRRAAEAKIEADRRAAEADRRAAEAKVEADRRAAQQAERDAKVDKEREELRRQIGSFHNKMGNFAEGLLLPSVKKILQDLGMEQISERTLRNRKVDGKKTFIELDAFGYVNGELNTAYIVEIKSNLREEGITQILRELRDFPDFFRDHADKRLYGIIAAVEVPAELYERVWSEGLYLVTVHDEIVELAVPAGFVPKNFGR